MLSGWSFFVHKLRGYFSMRWKPRKILLLSFCSAVIFFLVHWQYETAGMKYAEIELDHEKIRLSIHFIEKKPSVWNRTVVLLHDQFYDSRIWLQTKTLDILQAAGYRAIAIDLPGHGYSRGPTANPRFSTRAIILREILKTLDAANAVLVSPAMSGTFSLPLIVRGNLPITGFVPIGVEGADHFSAVEYGMLHIPTYIMYGENDKGISEIARSYLHHIKGWQEYLVSGAGYPCYLSSPIEFNSALLSFLNTLP